MVRSAARMMISSGAEVVAIARAAAAITEVDGVRNPDWMAADFVPLAPRLGAIVHIPIVRRHALSVLNRTSPGLCCYEIGRTTHLDRGMMRAIDDGVDQTVILGAGLDSRAYRFRAELAGARVFEVDQPAAIEHKRQRVKHVVGDLPDNVEYVDVELGRDSLGDALAARGFSSERRCFVLWSGVSMYLSAAAVDSVFEFTRSRCAAGSSIAFDYMYARALDEGSDYYGAPEHRRGAAMVGEPLRFGIDEGAIGAFLDERGLDLVSHLAPDQLEREYLTGKSGRSIGRPYGHLAIAEARTRA